MDESINVDKEASRESGQLKIPASRSVALSRDELRIANRLIEFFKKHGEVIFYAGDKKYPPGHSENISIQLVGASRPKQLGLVVVNMPSRPQTIYLDFEKGQLITPIPSDARTVLLSLSSYNIPQMTKKGLDELKSKLENGKLDFQSTYEITKNQNRWRVEENNKGEVVLELWDRTSQKGMRYERYRLSPNGTLLKGWSKISEKGKKEVIDRLTPREAIIRIQQWKNEYELKDMRLEHGLTFYNLEPK